MKGSVTWFATNPVAANLLALCIVVGGVLSLFSIKREVFPEFSPDQISVSVAYPGATPAEVEEAICIRVEEQVQSLDGVKRIRSTAAEGVGTVTVELLIDADKSRMLDDVKARVDAIDTFPEDAEEPLVREVEIRRQVLNVAISGQIEERALKQLAESLRDELLALDGITQVGIGNSRPYEISIEVSEYALRRHGLTFDAVANAVRRTSLDLPGGSVKTDRGEILLRTKGQAYVGEEFERIVLLTRADGTRVELGDVATVVDGFRDTDQSATFDGEPAMLLEVFRVGEQDALVVSSTVREWLPGAQRRVPDGVKLTVWSNEADLLQDRQDLLVRNGLSGFVLVFVVLALFLRFKLALWVSLGIPISFLGTLWLMPALGTSINMLSLFAFILVLGIVVDDAIVVGENIYAHSLRQRSSLKAAIEGTKEVAVPVTFAILTTVAAFLPMLNVPGNTGPLWAVIPAVVIPTLLFSMVESKWVLPAHLRHLDVVEPKGGIAAVWLRFQRLFAGGMESFATKLYRPALEFAVRRRYLTVATMVATLVITVGSIAGGWIRFVFFPAVEGDNAVAILTMPQGTPAEVTKSAVARIERAALKLREEYGDDMVRHVLSSVGEQPFRKLQEEGAGRVAETYSAAHYGEVNVQLAPSEQRTVESVEIADRLRELVGPVPGASELSYSSSLISVGADIDVRLAGPDLTVLRRVADELKRRLAQYPSVSDITDSFLDGKEEVQIAVRSEAETLGVTAADLARQVRQAFYGEEAQRVQRGRDDVRVMVRYPEDERRSLDNLESMRIRTNGGDEIPFSTVADASVGRGFSTIRRTDRKRTIGVTAEIDEKKSDVNTVLADFRTRHLDPVLADYPGVTYTFEGERREQQETLSGLGRGFLFALLLIYALMAIPFKSYTQPLIIMAAIPFGLVGAVAGHLLLGLDLSVLSMCGIVALAGVVVNDSLVLVDYVNRQRAEGLELLDAVRTAAVRRFRPIVLTSLTTFAGLTPIILEKSVQAKILIPMAVSLAFGVLFATVIILGLVPALYAILDDVHRLFGRRDRARPQAAD